jgi:outer membrane receptor for ferric coprogen and ferric-rhodotorulic acid
MSYLSPSFLIHRHDLRLHPLVLAISLLFSATGIARASEPVTEDPVAVVTIKGTASHSAYSAGHTSSATGLDLSLRETPQSVSVVTRAVMDDFKLDNLNAVLGSAGGVSIEKVETERTYYMARGFDVTSFQYDGVGLPLSGWDVALGELDTALYERIDIVRGANGLMTSTGNPSATINFIRKRPGKTFEAAASLSQGSWDTRRLVGDVSVPLNESGSVAGRAVLVRQDSGSYLDRYSAQKTVGYGVLEARLGDDTLLAIGHTEQRNRPHGTMWGALPLSYSDGSPTDYPRSASTSADWTAWNTDVSSSFAELSHTLANGWRARATFSYNTSASRGKLLYIYGLPDRATGDGMFSYPSIYNADSNQSLLDLSASGQFMLAGRRHDLAFGLGWAKSRTQDESLFGRGIGTAVSAETVFSGTYPEPLFDASIDGGKFQERRKNASVAARFNLADHLKLLVGSNTAKASTSGMSYGAIQDKSASRNIPYVGAVVDLGENLSAYASYAEIFKPQNEVDIDRKMLGPVIGKSVELGAKGEFFDRKLNVSGAIFKAEQDNTAEQAGYLGVNPYYRATYAASRGAELELAGDLSRGWHATAHFTQLKIEGNDGAPAKLYLPRRMLRLASTYRLPFFPGITTGASLSWQDDTRRELGDGVVRRQPGYAVLGLMARYEIDRNLSLALNMNNVTDRKYLTSLLTTQGHYAAPRHGNVTLHWQY